MCHVPAAATPRHVSRHRLNPPPIHNPYHLAPNNQSPPPRPPGACLPDTLESRRTKWSRPQDTGDATKASAEYQLLPDRTVYTEPEPTRWPRPPKEEGEAARNNVVMSAGKRSCPDIICYLLSVGYRVREASDTSVNTLLRQSCCRATGDQPEVVEESWVCECCGRVEEVRGYN